jgi:hypothetical protein
MHALSAPVMGQMRMLAAYGPAHIHTGVLPVSEVSARLTSITRLALQ